MRNSEKTDVFAQARSCICRYIIEKYYSAKGSKWVKGEYWTLSPLRADDNVKSGTFSINESGLYNDLATGESGDFIKLVSLTFRISLKEAAEKIVSDSGMNTGAMELNTRKPKKEKPKKIGVAFDRTEYLIKKESFEKEAERLANFYSKKYDKDFNPIAAYNYKDEKNNFLFFVIRFEEAESQIGEKPQKIFTQVYLNHEGKVKTGIPDNFIPRPLYKLNEIINNKELPVILVEGEKCAAIDVEGYITTTWCGGAQSIEKTDWEVLKKRDVFYWPDNDNAGLSTIEKLRSLIPKLYVLDISSLDKPEKWDIADAVEEGENIQVLIEELKRKDQESNGIKLDPEYAADKFLEVLYNEHNLDKFDGIFWRYSEEKHYWTIIDFANIRADIQTFLKNNGYFEMLETQEMSKVNFKNSVISLISDHSSKYFDVNPFIEAALSPYIHVQNGAIKLLDKGKFKFLDREKYGEDLFRKLHPVSCFDFNYCQNDNQYTFDNIENIAPVFCYCIKSIIPKNIYSEEVLKETLHFALRIIIYCMSPIKKHPYFFGFYGDQGSSKSSLYYLIRSFIGEQFIVSRAIEELANNRFGASDLWGAKMLVDEDMNENDMLPASFIKKYSGESTVSIERKHENSQKGVKLSIAMFFISNYKFKTYGVEGIERRSIFMKFENKILKKNMDPDIINRFCGKAKHNNLTPEHSGQTFDERSGLIHVILEELELMANDNHVINMPSWVRKSTDEIVSGMTSSMEYLKVAASGDRDTITPNSKYTIEYLYNDYKDWCSDEGRKPKGKGNFEEEIKRDEKRILGNQRLDNRRKGVYKLLEYRVEEAENESDDYYDDKIPF